MLTLALLCTVIVTLKVPISDSFVCLKLRIVRPYGSKVRNDAAFSSNLAISSRSELFNRDYGGGTGNPSLILKFSSKVKL